MQRSPVHPIPLRVVLAAALLGHAAFAQEPSKQQTQLRSQIESALTRPWQITGIEAVDPNAAGWGEDLAGIKSGGFVVTCEDPTVTSTDARSKDGSNSAGRHPGFMLWFIDRSASVTPEAVHAKMGMTSPMVQRARPVELGSNSQYIVACMDQCSGPQVDAIVAKLKLKPIQQTH